MPKSKHSKLLSKARKALKDDLKQAKMPGTGVRPGSKLDKQIRKSVDAAGLLAQAGLQHGTPLIAPQRIPSTHTELRHSKQGVILHATEVFHEIDSTVGFINRPFGLVPTNVLLFPTAQTMALAFTKAKIRRCEVHYHPTCSALQTGRIGMVYINDPKRNAPVNFRELLAFEGAEVGPVYQDAHIKCKLDRSYEYFLQTYTGFSDSQLRFEMPGYIVVATDECATGDADLPAGVLSVSYEIEFYDVRAPSQLTANFVSNEDQPITDGTAVGGTFYQNVKTPDSEQVVGYFGHSNPVKSDLGASLWGAFEAVVVDAGSWLINNAFDYLVSAVVPDEESDVEQWVLRPSDDDSKSPVLCLKQTSKDGDVSVFRDPHLIEFLSRREDAVEAVLNAAQDHKKDNNSLNFMRLIQRVHEYRLEFTPFNAHWTATPSTVKKQLRKHFGQRSIHLGPALDEISMIRIRALITVPNGVPTVPLFPGCKYDPDVEVTVTATQWCGDPASGASVFVKSQAVSSTVDARETAVLRVYDSSVSSGCTFAVQLSCPDTHTILLNAPSETTQAAVNDSTALVDGNSVSVQSKELAETDIDFESA